MLSRIDGYASLAHRPVGAAQLISPQSRTFHASTAARSAGGRYCPKRRDFDLLRRGDLVTYLRLLDAEADGADWTEATRLVLHIDASREPARARRAWESHLARAKWMTEHGYQHLLRGRAAG